MKKLVIIAIALFALQSCASGGYCVQNEALNPLSRQYSCNR